MIQSDGSLQIRKIYEVIFALEDLRKTFRQPLPTGFNELHMAKEAMPDFARLSIGIEGVEDIIADLDQAMARAV